MFIIDQTLRAAFRASNTQSRFFFGRRVIRNRQDIRDAAEFIYNKGVPFRKRLLEASQQYAMRGSDAKAALASLIDTIAERVYGFFNLDGNTLNDQEHFDTFHRGLCKCVLNELNRIRAFPTVGYPPVCYGTAQKWINVLFKYLACFDDYEGFADLFAYAHMPIDSYILRDLGKLGVVGAADSKYLGQRWELLSEDDYFGLLKAIRRDLRPLLSTDASYLHVEFAIWSQEIRCRAAIAALLPTTGVLATPIFTFHR